MNSKIDNGAAVPFGRNSRGEEHTIEEADDKIWYFCPKCGERLQQRRGIKNKHYFAHYPNTPDCEWKIDSNIASDREKIREDAIRDNTNRIRLFVEKDSYSSQLFLYGSIPTFKVEDIAIMTQDSQTQTVINSVGTIRQISKNDLLPSNRVGWIELDPSAQSYEISIPYPASMAGSWNARELSPNAVFVGDSVRGEFVDDPNHLAVGDSVYVISPTSVENMPKENKMFRLGTKDVLMVEISQENKNDIKKWLSKLVEHELFVDDNPMRVDIIYPFMTDPRARFGYIQGTSESEALIAIVPPPTEDPNLELIPLPFFSENNVLNLDKIGVGTPRFLRISLDKMYCKRLLIHWPLHKHRDILLEFSIVNGEPEYEIPSALEFGIEVQDGTSIPQIYPVLSTQKLELHPVTENQDGAVLPYIKLLCPKRFKVKLRAEYPDSKGLPLWKEEGDAVVEDFMERAKAIMDTGARSLDVQFKTLGTIHVDCSSFYKKIFDEQTRRLEEQTRRHAKERKEYINVNFSKIIRMYLCNLDQLPKHATQEFLCDCLKRIGVIEVTPPEFKKYRRKIKNAKNAIRKQRKKLINCDIRYCSKKFLGGHSDEQLG